MGTILKMKPADLVRKANRDEKVETSFDLKIAGETAKYYLTAPDMFEILKEQEICYQAAYAECEQRGLHKKLINQSDWEKELNRIEDPATRKALMDDKPANLAEQIAKKNSRFDTIRVLLPKVLKVDGDNGKELAFPSFEDQKDFGEYIAAHPDVMNTLTKNYVEIMNKLNEVNAVAKNFQTETDSQSSASNVKSQENILCMEPHSPKK